MIDFIVRLVGYALLLGISSRVAQNAWTNLGLDALDVLQPLHAGGIMVLLVAPAVLALLGVRALRPVCVFVAFALAGAALTAPFVIARVAGV
jgi:hypothetical protein